MSTSTRALWVRWLMAMNRRHQLDARCRRLSARGLSDDLVALLRSANSARHIARVEVLTRGQIASLNEAAVKRSDGVRRQDT